MGATSIRAMGKTSDGLVESADGESISEITFLGDPYTFNEDDIGAPVASETPLHPADGLIPIAQVATGRQRVSRPAIIDVTEEVNIVVVASRDLGEPYIKALAIAWSVEVIFGVNAVVVAISDSIDGRVKGRVYIGNDGAICPNLIQDSTRIAGVISGGSIELVGLVRINTVAVLIAAVPTDLSLRPLTFSALAKLSPLTQKVT